MKRSWLVKQRQRRRCKVKYCRRTCRKHHRICSTHDKRFWREKYPMKAAFQTLRQNARRRGIDFGLTFEDFQMFCRATKYIAGKGRKKDSFTIDRINNDKGYVLSNIQMLTKSDNSRKATKLLMYDWRTKYARVV